MQAGNSEENAITAINITPLVDVSLVLVIIFMITMPYMMERSMRVQAAQEKVVDVSSVKEPILVELSEKDIRVEGKSVSMDELPQALGHLMSERGVGVVAVSADPKVLHGRVVQVLDQVMESGAQDLDLLEPQEMLGHARH